MGHQARVLHSHQGWSIDDSHPSYHILNSSSALKHLMNALPSGETENGIKRSWIRDVEAYVQAHASDIMQSAVFRRAPIAVVQRVLSLPTFNISEDEVLEYVIQYAVESANVLTDAPNIWTCEEKEAVLPILSQLLPFLRVFSLSTQKFLQVVEPLGILGMPELVDKYRFDALARQLCSGRVRNPEGHTFATIRRCYKEPERRQEILESKLRGLVNMSESAHPYYLGEDEILEEVRAAPWAPRLLVEFDRRSCIGPGAKLTFYGDPDATEVLGSWEDMWTKDRRSVKTWIVHGHRFFVGFRSSLTAEAAWGWKLIAAPIFAPQDFEPGCTGLPI